MAVQNTRDLARRINFTKRTIEALAPPAAGHYYVYDRTQANLGLCVLASGIKTFYRCGRYDGRSERYKLGRWPDLTVENARKAARSLTGDIAKGINPKRKRDTTGTVEALFEHWLVKAKLVKKSWPADQANFDYHFGPLRHRRFASLTTDEITKWHVTIGKKRGPVIANRCRALLSTIYGKAHELGFDGPNPVLKVERFPESSRERFLLPAEMRPFFEALKAEPPDWRDFWLLALFTGARRGNVASMAWADIDLPQGIWYLGGEKLKNGMPLAIALTPPAAAILQDRHDGRGESRWVFPSNSDAGHIRDPRKSWLRVIKAAGIPDLHPHDLRRSLGSWQALAGTSLQIIGQSLGHRDVKSTAVYARLLLAPVRASVDGAVMAMIEAAESKPVKPKRKGAGNGKA